MTENELRTPATPTAAQSAALLAADAALWEALATWDMTPNGDTAYLLLKAYESLVTTDPALALTREALADGIALRRLPDDVDVRLTKHARGGGWRVGSIAERPTLPSAVAAALDER